MDYAAYRRFRDSLLEKRKPLRLDCMNPAKALATWGPPSRTAPYARVTRDEALAAWSRATGMRGEAAWLGTGVRDLLSRLVTALGPEVDEVWCPEDVYPVYAQLLGTRPRRDYRTLPEVDWGFLGESSRRAVLLCPLPLAPLGRLPRTAEVTRLTRWLEESPERLAVVDAVYTYDFAAVADALAPLFATGRVVALWSCTKSWLLPDALGVATMSRALEEALGGDARLPSPAGLARATEWLTARPALPAAQQEAFAREWQRLAPRIREAWPDWKPPETGYFSVVGVPFEELLERHAVLAVPATVFGSRSGATSVVTCLHDVVEHEGGGG